MATTSHASHTSVLDAPSLMARLISFVNDAEVCPPPDAPAAVAGYGSSGEATDSAGLDSVTDAVSQAVQAVPLQAFAVKRALPLVTPVRSGVAGLADDAEGFRQQQRELCLLVCILQRPRSVYTYWLGYTRFLEALRAVNVVEQIVTAMEWLCNLASKEAARQSSNAFSTPSADRRNDRYASLLRRYSEALLLYVFYHSSYAAPSNGAPIGADLGVDSSFLSSLGPKTEEAPLTAAVVSSLFRVARRLASETSNTYQGAALMLACTLCVPSFQQLLSFKELHGAAAQASDAPDAVTNIVVVSSVPYWLLERRVAQEGDGSVPPVDNSEVRAEALEWLRVAVEVCATVTVYDVDVSVLFRTDGTSVSTFSLVKSVVAGVYESLWNCLSPNAWYVFSKAALWSAAKSMGIYAYAWGSIPRALGPLLSLVQFQLGQFDRARAKSKTALGGARHSSGADSAATVAKEQSGASKALNTNFNTLLSGAMGVSPYEPSTYSVINSPEPDVSAAVRGNVGDDDEDKEANEFAKRTQNFTMSFSFSTERAHTAYYLSVYAYIVSALPFLCERFSDIRNTLQWAIPTELYQRCHTDGRDSSDATAAAQDSLARASGWLTNVGDFSVDVDAATDTRLVETHSYLTFPMPPRFTEPGKVNLLSQLLELLTMVARSGASWDTTQTYSTNSALLYRLAESGLALLHSLLSCYPREVSTVSHFAHIDVLTTLQVVALWQVGLPFPTFHGQELTYSLLHRYFTIFPNLQTLASRLLKAETLRAVGRQCGVVERLVLDNHLYTRLVTSDDDVSGLFAQPILASLCSVSEGMIAGTADGGHLFVDSVTTLLKIIQSTPNMSLRRLFDEAPLSVDDLVRRLCEGLLFLYKQWVAGNTYVHNRCTLQLLTVTLQVLSSTLTLTHSGAESVSTFVVPSTSEPYESLSLADPATCGIYAALRLLFRPELDSLDVVESAAEFLAVCVSHATTPLSIAVHSSCSRETAIRIASDVVAVLRAHEGQVENVYRLEALRVVLRADWRLFHFLTGSESLEANAQSKSSRDLVFFKQLTTTICGTKASKLEQAAALSLLIHGTDMGEDGPLASRVGELLEQEPANPLSNTFESVALSAVCVEYLNTRIAHGMAVSATTSTAPVAPATPRRSPSTRPAQEPSGAAGTPSHRGSSSARLAPLASPPSTPRQTFARFDRDQSDAVDKASRCGTRALQNGLDFLSRLLANLFYDERVSLIGDPGAVLANPRDTVGEPAVDVSATTAATLSRVGGAAFSSIVTRSATSAVAAPVSQLVQDESTLRLPSTTKLHQLSDSLWRATASAASRNAQTRSLAGCTAKVTNPFHTSVLPDPIADEETLYLKPYALVLGTTYCFRSTENDAHLNAIASVMETMGRLAVALECTVYLGSRDPDRNTLFLTRTLATLESSLGCLLVLKPSLPLLNRTLWSYMNRCLRLVLALCRTTRTAHTLDDDGATAELRAALDKLGHFAFHNRRHLPIVNACLEVAYSLPPALFAEYGTLSTFFTAAQCALVDHVTDVSLQPDVVALVHHVTALTKVAFRMCPSPTLAIMVQTLWKHAENVSHVVVASEASGPAVTVLVECVQCLKSCVSQSDLSLVQTLLPRAAIVGMASALGQFHRTDVYDAACSVYRRQAWHAAWVSLLELLHAVVVFHPSWRSAEAESISSDDDWPLSVAEALTASARFSHAVSAFDLPSHQAASEALRREPGTATGASTDQALPTNLPSLFVWDVEEIELCTRLMAALSAVGHHMPGLFPRVQNAFVSLHRFRILRYCTATNGTPDVVAAESRRVEAAIARTVRHQLHILFQWPTKVMPSSENGYPALSFPCFHQYAARGVATGALVHHRDVSRIEHRRLRGEAPERSLHTDAENEWWVLVEAVSLSMDVLRRFIVDELQLVRRLSALDPSGGGGLSPDRSSSTKPHSRESSVTRSPAFGRGVGGTPALRGASGVVGESLLYEDSETVTTDEDSGTLAAEGGVSLHVGVRSVHVECVQLALGLFTAGAAECLYGETVMSGHFDTLTFQRDLLTSVNKLLDALDSVHKDIRKANSPALSAAVEAMRSRLRTIKSALLA